ncbi:hypothetical protein [Mucilaginibacter sp. OK098]|uniref:hypothetical protein n=1 Tax=Mucilaginibacter sp. OK098 TaxID=1855297 RepID=UPI00091A99FE|nr:hypothetical protein [Mucilaginibacter sp. OK098]SHM19261.1 hypothetical protein SAMN05216524_1011109 [Mucilaginibacter sp. OK098]
MNKPLTNILLKIFASGFYRAHAGILCVGFFVMFGMVEPGQLLNYHKTLMLTLVSSPLMMVVVFACWLIYTIKSWHYVIGQITAVNQQFLFYSSNAFTKNRQFKSWFYLQLVLLLPISVYGAIAAGVGLAHHYYLIPLAIIAYLFLLAGLSAILYHGTVNKLVDGSTQGWMLTLSSKWRKPWFSLFIYHVFDQHKITWLVTKALSYLLITGFFLLFADVAHDIRVAGIALLAVVVAHVKLIFEERSFEEKWLSFTRNLPYSRVRLFGSFAGVYLILMFPESIWLFSRFNPLIAFELLLAGISIAMLFHCLLYYIGLDMEKYMLWIFFLFVVIFWLILFKLLLVLVVLNLVVSFGVFWKCYYRSRIVADQGD